MEAAGARNDGVGRSRGGWASCVVKSSPGGVGRPCAVARSVVDVGKPKAGSSAVDCCWLTARAGTSVDTLVSALIVAGTEILPLSACLLNSLTLLASGIFFVFGAADLGRPRATSFAFASLAACSSLDGTFNLMLIFFKLDTRWSTASVLTSPLLDNGI